MNIGIFEDAGYKRLLPLTWLRAAFELRCGYDRLIDKLTVGFGQVPQRIWLRDVLAEVVLGRTPLRAPQGSENWCLVNSRALVTQSILPPPPNVAWRQDGEIIAVGVEPDEVARLSPEFFLDEARVAEWSADLTTAPTPDGIRLINHPWDLLSANSSELARQFAEQRGIAGEVYPGAHLVADSGIHIAHGAIVKPGAVIDAECGPVFIERGALVQSNAVISGPVYLGPRTIVRPGAVLRDGVSIGPACKVGGEIEASIFQGFANKQHDGFLGHSIIGEWVNLGAGTITSDLKNTYGTIRAAVNGVGVETGLRFLGAIVGDHSKTAIGACLPTGCIIGVASNVLRQFDVPRFVPSFAWLTSAGLSAYHVEKAVEIARAVMARREVELSAADRRLLEATASLARDVEAAGW